MGFLSRRSPMKAGNGNPHDALFRVIKSQQDQIKRLSVQVFSLKAQNESLRLQVGTEAL